MLNDPICQNYFLPLNKENSDEYIEFFNNRIKDEKLLQEDKIVWIELLKEKNPDIYSQVTIPTDLFQAPDLSEKNLSAVNIVPLVSMQAASSLSAYDEQKNNSLYRKIKEKIESNSGEEISLSKEELELFISSAFQRRLSALYASAQNLKSNETVQADMMMEDRGNNEPTQSDINEDDDKEYQERAAKKRKTNERETVNITTASSTIAANQNFLSYRNDGSREISVNISELERQALSILNETNIEKPQENIEVKKILFDLMQIDEQINLAIDGSECEKRAVQASESHVHQEQIFDVEISLESSGSFEMDPKFNEILNDLKEDNMGRLPENVLSQSSSVLFTLLNGTNESRPDGQEKYKESDYPYYA